MEYLTPEETEIILEAFRTIVNTAKGKVINLTPKERSGLGCIKEKNKLKVDKTKEYLDEHPEHIPNVISKEKFLSDYENRRLLEIFLIHTQELNEIFSDTKIYYDKKNMKDTLSYYRYIKFLSREDIPGITTIYEGLKQFFKHKKKRKNKPEKGE